MLQPEVVDSDHVFRVAYWHNAVIVDVGGDMDLVHMQRLGRAYRDLAEKSPGGIVSCAFLRAEVPVSSAPARAESARFMKDLGNSILRVAMVSEHRGVLVQMITTIIRGINVVARNPKLVVLRSVEEVARVVAPLVHSKGSTPETPETLMAAIAHVRRGYESMARNLG
jgi:hypothetical protein